MTCFTPDALVGSLGIDFRHESYLLSGRKFLSRVLAPSDFLDFQDFPESREFQDSKAKISVARRHIRVASKHILVTLRHIWVATRCVWIAPSSILVAPRYIRVVPNHILVGRRKNPDVMMLHRIWKYASWRYCWVRIYVLDSNIHIQRSNKKYPGKAP